MSQPRTPVGGMTRGNNNNELLLRLQQRRYLVEGGSGPVSERTSFGGAAPRSPQHSVSSNGHHGAQTVFVARAQPRQPASFRGGYSFPPSAGSGTNSPVYPWAVPVNQAHRSGDQLSRSAPNSTGQLPRPVGPTQLIRQEQHLVGKMQQHISETNGFIAHARAKQQDGACLAAEVAELRGAQSEWAEAIAQAQSDKLDAEKTRDDFQERYEAERLQLIASRDELRAQSEECEELAHRDEFHEVKEQKLLAEKSELEQTFRVTRRSLGATENDRDRLRTEAEELRRERDTLEAQNHTLKSTNENLQLSLDVMTEENKALHEVLSGASCSGCRLRATLTKQSASIEELKSAILGVDSLLDQARRELAQQELREKRAAIEQLHEAMANRLDEAALEVAIERSTKAGVAEEDVQKAADILAELRALTPEEKERRVAQKVEKLRKEEAFTYAKRDRVLELETLLDELGAGVAWENWHDSQGRTLLRVAHQLRSEGATKVLEDRIERKHPGTIKQEVHHHHHVRRSSKDLLAAPVRASLASSQSAQDDVDVHMDGAVADALSRQNSREMSRQGSVCMSGRPSELSMLEPPAVGTQSASSSVPPTPPAAALGFGGADAGSAELAAAAFAGLDGGAVGSTTPAQPVSPGAGQNGQAASASWRSWYEDDAPGSTMSSAVVPEPPQSSGPGRPSKEEEERLKTEAFRNCARGDAEKLLEVLEAVPAELWTTWRNKAGKDLEQLCLERGEKCEGCLRVIFKASGRERKVEREYYEEGEHVWVHVKGEVQARQATVMEDTPIEEDTILIQFWAGYDDPDYVERGVVSKMLGQ